MNRTWGTLITIFWILISLIIISIAFLKSLVTLRFHELTFMRRVSIYGMSQPPRLFLVTLHPFSSVFLQILSCLSLGIVSAFEVSRLHWAFVTRRQSDSWLSDRFRGCVVWVEVARGGESVRTLCGRLLSSTLLARRPTE
jgi:hypothetical protein